LNIARLQTAYELARDDLCNAREPADENGERHWVGELASSALSTATAISALALVARHLPIDEETGRFHDEVYEAKLNNLIIKGLHWLAERQNEDGGWGDTDLSYSNIATTMLVNAAFHLNGAPADHADMLKRAEAYIKSKGGIAGLKERYGRDKTFAVPILTNYALAGLIDWKHVSALPFEAACVPQSWYRLMQLPVVSYAIPALVAIGQACYFHRKPMLLPLRWLRAWAVKPSLKVLSRIQPASGGYLEATPLTSFVVMSLAATKRTDHEVTKAGVKFLINSVREDGSWPIDTDLATWNTTLALHALNSGGENLAELTPLKWLLSCQYKETHPFTGSPPGGWGWTDLTGSVPDADDTPGALLALAAWRNRELDATDQEADSATLETVVSAAENGVLWLLGLQNRDGGWPTFCRGWGKLPFDRSGADLTAHAMRALHAWKDSLTENQNLAPRIEKAMKRGRRYLERQQHEDGSWVPLWFGNQDHSEEENPVYGTAKVLAAFVALDETETIPANRGFQWLVEHQNLDGGWGGDCRQASLAAATKTEDTGKTAQSRKNNENGKFDTVSSIEETALAVEALLAAPIHEKIEMSINKGLEFLVSAIEQGRHTQPAPIGFYFAKLWYYEEAYPLTFTVSALGKAVSARQKDNSQVAASSQ